MSASPATGLVVGHVADALVGDPRRWHPVAGFGHVATVAEKRVWADDRCIGVAFVTGLVGGVVLLTVLVQRLAGRVPGGRTAVVAAAAWAASGRTSLVVEGRAMQRLLAADDIDAARQRLAHLCGRDASGLDRESLVRATVESIAENTSDAVVAPVAWGVLGGAPGIVGYRALNTLDAMIGSRTSRYRRFGWAAARLDDLANLLPARLTALLVVLCAPLVHGRPRAAWDSWRRDASGHPSPNAGPVEAAFAGALGVRLGGTVNTYGDHRDRRPVLGDGRPVVVGDIDRANRLSRAVGLAALAICVVAARQAGRP